jgi:anti-sigma regulatory factor (Ser/Thr protein kinase)
MAFYACPNCGVSIASAAGAQPACPSCCARLHLEEDLPALVRTPLGSDRFAPSGARHALAPLRADLGEESFQVCELLVSELVTNVVRHSASGGSPAASDMQVRVYPDRVRVEVRDDGPGFGSVKTNGERPPGSGWGLFLVDELADEWGVQSGAQNCVWFELAHN